MIVLRAIVVLACIAGLSTATSARAAKPLVLHVAVTGNDGNSGDAGHPLATPEGARDRARLVRNTVKNMSLDVVFAPGVYEIGRSFILEEHDSGDSLAPVTYRAEKPGTVRFIGGKRITQYHALADATVLRGMDPACAGQVMVCDLKINGIPDAGTLRPRGFGKPVVPSALELFIEGVPLTLARWPNDGWATISDTLTGLSKSAFTYTADRAHRWSREPEVWLHGYWTWDWADSYTRVASIDTVGGVITTTPPHGVYGYAPGKRFYALNVLAELDRPGEYYVDRTSQLLYFWPLRSDTRQEIIASVLETPMIVLNNVSWLTIAGLTLECTRGAGVEIIDGAHARIAGCTVRNIGTVGVSIGRLVPTILGECQGNTLYTGSAGHRNGVQSCLIERCGDGGVYLFGGDRASLSPGHNYVDNCLITDCCRWSRTYRAGVYMWGVGNRVSHSVIHGLPHSAVFFWGNDHLLEYNEIFDVCRETGDAGAFYQGRDWTQQGNQIRNNYFHDVRGVQGQGGFTDVMSVYMDDFASGTTVYGNVFVNGGRTVMVGGGRDVRIENNLIIDGQPAVHVDARGKRDWAAAMFQGQNSVLMERLRAVHHKEPPYSLRYPHLVTVLDEDPTIPARISVRHNISYGGIWRELQDGVTDSLVQFEANFVEGDPGFVNAGKKDFRLRADAPALRDGFARLPLEKIGLYNDAYRPEKGRVTRTIPGMIVPEKGTSLQ